MYINPFVTQLLVEERIEDVMRLAEQARLIREVEGSRKSWRWRLPILLALKSLFALVIRPQS